MPDIPISLRSPRAIADEAMRIYGGLDAAIKKQHEGEFMVVDVKSGQHVIDKFSEEAFRLAREKEPHGIFHLIRIGAPAAFKVSQTASRDQGWAWGA